MCNVVSHDVGSRVKCLCASSHPCVMRLSSTLVSHSSFVSPIFHFILLNFDFYLFLFHVDVAGARSPVQRSLALWPITRLSHFASRRFIDCKSMNALHFGDPSKSSGLSFLKYSHKRSTFACISHPNSCATCQKVAQVSGPYDSASLRSWVG